MTATATCVSKTTAETAITGNGHPVISQARNAFGHAFVYVGDAFATAALIRGSTDAGKKALKLVELILEAMPTTLSLTNFKNLTMQTRTGLDLYDFVDDCSPTALRTLRKAPLYERCHKVFFAVANFGGALLILRTYKVISLGRMTAIMSRIPVFGLATTVSLGSVVTVAAVAGFFFLTLETWQKRSRQNEDQEQVKLDLVYNGGMLAYEVLSIAGLNAALLRTLGIVSTVYGLKSFCYTQNKEAVRAEAPLKAA